MEGGLVKRALQLWPKSSFFFSSSMMNALMQCPSCKVFFSSPAEHGLDRLGQSNPWAWVVLPPAQDDESANADTEASDEAGTTEEARDGGEGRGDVRDGGGGR